MKKLLVLLCLAITLGAAAKKYTFHTIIEKNKKFIEKEGLKGKNVKNVIVCFTYIGKYPNRKRIILIKDLDSGEFLTSSVVGTIPKKFELVMKKLINKYYDMYKNTKEKDEQYKKAERHFKETPKDPETKAIITYPEYNLWLYLADEEDVKE